MEIDEDGVTVADRLLAQLGAALPEATRVRVAGAGPPSQGQCCRCWRCVLPLSESVTSFGASPPISGTGRRPSRAVAPHHTRSAGTFPLVPRRRGTRVPLTSAHLGEPLRTQRAGGCRTRFVATGAADVRAAAFSPTSAHVSFASGVRAPRSSVFDWERHVEPSEDRLRRLAGSTRSAFIKLWASRRPLLNGPFRA